MQKRIHDVLCDFSNKTLKKPQKKSRGRKKKAEAMDHRNMVKVLAQGLDKDQKFHPAYGYAKSTHSEYLHSSLEEITGKDPALAFAMKGKNREDPTLVPNALYRLVPSIEKPALLEKDALD